LLLVVAAATAVYDQTPAANLNPVQFWAILTGSTGEQALCAGRYVCTSGYVLTVWCQHNISMSTPVAAYLQSSSGTNTMTNTVGTFTATNAQWGIFMLNSLSLTKAQACSLFAGTLGVSIQSSSMMTGLLWGLLMPVTSSGAPTHIATLDDLQSGVNTGSSFTNNTGVGFVWVTSSAVYVSIFHNQVILANVGQHIHGPANPGVQGAAVLYPVCGTGAGGAADCVSPGKDNWDVKYPFTLITSGFGNATTLNQGLTYLNVHTATYSGGSIRGQVVQVAAGTAPMSCTSAAFTTFQMSGMLMAMLAMLALLFQ